MQGTPQSPLFDPDDKLRLHRVALASLAGALVIAAAVTFFVHGLSPADGWGVAVGVGLMIGFFIGPLPGVVVGNWIHENDLDHRGAGGH